MTINVSLFKKLREIICARDNLRGQKSLGPLKISLKMAHKVIVPPKKLYPAVSKQRDINSYYAVLVGGEK